MNVRESRFKDEGRNKKILLIYLIIPGFYVIPGNSGVMPII